MTVETVLSSEDMVDIETAPDAVPGNIKGEIYIGGVKVGSYDPDTGVVSITPNRTGHFNMKLKLTNGIVPAESTGHTIDVVKPWPGVDSETLDLEDDTTRAIPVMTWADFSSSAFSGLFVSDTTFWRYVDNPGNNFTGAQQAILDAVGMGGGGDDLIETPTADQANVYSDYASRTLFIPVQVDVDDPADDPDYGATSTSLQRAST